MYLYSYFRKNIKSRFCMEKTRSLPPKNPYIIVIVILNTPKKEIYSFFILVLFLDETETPTLILGSNYKIRDNKHTKLKYFLFEEFSQQIKVKVLLTKSKPESRIIRMAFNAENTLIFMNWLVDNKIQLEHCVTFWGNTWELFMESDVAKANTQLFVQAMITKTVENPVRKNAKAKKVVDPVIDPVTGEPVIVEKKVAEKKPRAPKKPVIDPVTGEPVIVEKKVAEKKPRAPKKPVIDPVTGEPVIVEKKVAEKKPRAPKKTKSQVVIEEPVVVTTEEEPVVVTTEEEPVVVTTEEEPVVTTTEEPVVVTTEEEPVVTTTTEEPVVVATEEKEKKVTEKKPRAKKTKAHVEVESVSEDDTVVAVMPIDKKTKKPRAKKVVTAISETTTELEDLLQNMTISEPATQPVAVAVETKTKKPKAKKVVENTTSSIETGLEDLLQTMTITEVVEVEKKTKKPRAKKQDAVVATTTTTQEVLAPVEEPVEIIGEVIHNEESFDEIQLQELTYGDKQLYMDVENNVYDETFTIVGRYIDENTIDFN